MDEMIFKIRHNSKFNGCDPVTHAALDGAAKQHIRKIVKGPGENLYHLNCWSNEQSQIFTYHFIFPRYFEVIS